MSTGLKIYIIMPVIMCVAVIAWLVYLEMRVDRVLTASVDESPVAAAEHTASYTLPDKYSAPVNDGADIDTVTSAAPVSQSADSVDAELDELLDLALLAEEECCPEEAELAAFTDEPRDSFEAARRDLVAKHGEIPEIDIYLALLERKFNGALSDPGEYLEFSRLHAMFVPVPQNIETYQAIQKFFEEAVPGSIRINQ